MEKWLISVLISLIALTLAEFFQKVAISDDADLSVETGNLMNWSLMAIMSFVYLWIFGIPFIVNWGFSQWLLFGISSLIYFWAGTLFYRSFKGNSPSLSNIFLSVSSLNSLFLGIIFLEERLDWMDFLGVALVTAAIILANYHDLKKTGKISKYSLLALAGGFLFGIGYTFDKKYVLDLNPHVYAPILYLSMAFMNATFGARKIVNDFKLRKMTKSFLTSVIFAGIFYFAYSRFTFLSYYQGGSVGAVDVINNAVVITLIPLEIIVLKDHNNLLTKIISAIICFMGIAFLA